MPHEMSTDGKTATVTDGSFNIEQSFEKKAEALVKSVKATFRRSQEADAHSDAVFALAFLIVKIIDAAADSFEDDNMGHQARVSIVSNVLQGIPNEDQAAVNGNGSGEPGPDSDILAALMASLGADEDYDYDDDDGSFAA